MFIRIQNSNYCIIQEVTVKEPVYPEEKSGSSDEPPAKRAKRTSTRSAEESEDDSASTTAVSRHVPTPPPNTEFNSVLKYGLKMRLSPNLKESKPII